MPEQLVPRFRALLIAMTFAMNNSVSCESENVMQHTICFVHTWKHSRKTGNKDELVNPHLARTSCSSPI